MGKPLSTYHVPAGTFHVGAKEPLMLQAYLGTCVGLALHCQATGVGGLIHLLLPEPVFSHACPQPEKYASTGIPLFIQSILDAGAHRETLSACLAGGALVGPLNHQDLDLDIGGRTAETAATILTEQQISIVRSETGGFFTCCLSMDMTSGAFSIEPAGQSKLAVTAPVKTPTPDEIKAAIEGLKPIPQVALKVLRLIDDNQYDIETIANEIRKDQVITARTLQLANSAMFGAKRTISTLDHAIIFLGQNLLVKLILTAAVQGYYEQSAMGYALCKGGIYHHAIGCAQIAEALALKTGSVEPGRAYTAGLLHDIGKVVLDQYVTDAYPLFYRSIAEEEVSIQATEKRIFGIDHTEVGQYLARKWSFPGPLEQAIRHHHQPRQAAEHGTLSTLIYLADLLMSRFHTELEMERMETLELQAVMAAIGLTGGDFSDLVDTIPASVFKPMV
jgi:putative nucleotidyltransferase with HDIG domain